ncbi:1-deoxy-D-xylulose-5-phosphate reductoisomerase [Reinekea marinisedimentorum]|uniref:1-deoxy-D-xylulose 5-phosphate reductoisomerase n=1 Tax=Reinekea marinisedimentorum TaxID=230495 RepID=A0A4R3I5Y8_9GAMM|nr:1-deoxy-D-xylulose-5-phosphate reductoisomerase [Reinekea marinisedimentorum]TCS40713.1 1-deoxy-D-xylulose-5-phosphate reductoisomerase [Reinekea marinisedimentorum]
MSKANVTVLGATGSIGQSTLDVIAAHPDRFNVFALTGHSNLVQLAADIDRFKPVFAVVSDDDSRVKLAAMIAHSCEILVGEQAICDVASHDDVDMVMAAIVGAAGLKSSIAAAQAGKKLLLANKESLVVAGHLLMEAVKHSGAQLLPIDSEHNAIFQCLPGGRNSAEVKSVLLTASGGPFLNFSAQQLQSVTPEQAVAHPNWSMGRKISVDSASLMNKGLELIEACWLFDLKPADIEVVVHPQSVIHSMVRYVDGSVLAQLGAPDMRTPIAFGLAYPERIASGSDDLSFNQLLTLQFDQPDIARFPCLRLAMDAMNSGGTLPAVLNAANEVTVSAFLNNLIGFMDIPAINEQVMLATSAEPVASVDQLIAVDEQARLLAQQLIRTRL